MTLRQASAKMDIRLNKQASADYDNIWSYLKTESFNKAVNSWLRRQKKGKNPLQERDEETVDVIDDLQSLLKTEPIGVREKGDFAQTSKLPSDYLYYKRVTPIVSKGNCNNITIKSHLREEANVDDLRHIPSFKFEETFNTLIGNKINIYHFGDFKVEKANLVYYKKPQFYDFKKLDTVIEFSDDVADIFVDDACKIMSSDIESLNQKSLAQEREIEDT